MISTKTIIISAVTVLCLTIMVCMADSIISYKSELKSYKIELQDIQETLSTVENQQAQAFKDSLLNYLIAIRVQHPHIVVAKARIESANFTSPIFKENNNFIGMKLPMIRPTLAIGENRGHAVYNNWKECAIDYCIWQCLNARNLKEDEYIELSGVRYNVENSKNYPNQIRSVMNKEDEGRTTTDSGKKSSSK